MDFNKSFKELEKPIVWLHYAIGTIGIVAAFWLLMNQKIITAETALGLYFLAFFIVYVIIDRISHGILEL